MAGIASLRSAAATDTGTVRQNNEDSAYAGHRLYAVGDGLGGHVSGEVASRIAIRGIRGYDTARAAADPRGSLAAGIREANLQIGTAITHDLRLLGMGTTLTAMLFSGDTAAIGNIGDSRAYLLRDGILELLTEDHSLGNLVAESRASADVAARLVRYLDGRPDRSPDLILHAVRPSDRYLLCTDGLSGAVSAEAIRDALSGTGDPGAAAARLVGLAIQAGGQDNITVIVIDASAADQGDPVGVPVTIGAAA
jgi:PPM family protein phosphatase